MFLLQIQPSSRGKYVRMSGHSLEVQLRCHRDRTDKIPLSLCSGSCCLVTDDHITCKKEISGRKENWMVSILLVDIQTHYVQWGSPSRGQKAGKSIMDPKDLANRKKCSFWELCTLESGKIPNQQHRRREGEMKKCGEYNSELLQEHLKTEFQSRTLPCTWEQDISGSPVPGIVS